MKVGFLMKKTVLILVCIFILATATACSATPQTPPPVASPPDSAMDSAPPVEEQQPEQTLLYGKVTSVIGNEIDLNIGTTEEELPSTYQPPVEEKEEKEGSVPAMMLQPASDGEASFVEGGKVQKNESIIDITYGDETKSVLIPAGVQMVDLTGKGKSDLNSVKEGSVLRVTMQGETVVCVEFLS